MSINIQQNLRALFEEHLSSLFSSICCKVNPTTAFKIGIGINIGIFTQRYRTVWNTKKMHE